MSLSFPVEFNKCPNCGSEVKVAQSIIDSQIKEGLADKDLKGFAFISNTIQVDPRHPQLLPTFLSCFCDICAECGTLYCIRAESGKVKPGPPPKPMIFPGRG